MNARNTLLVPLLVVAGSMTAMLTGCSADVGDPAPTPATYEHLREDPPPEGPHPKKATPAPARHVAMNPSNSAVVAPIPQPVPNPVMPMPEPIDLGDAPGLRVGDEPPAGDSPQTGHQRYYGGTDNGRPL